MNDVKQKRHIVHDPCKHYCYHFIYTYLTLEGDHFTDFNIRRFLIINAVTVKHQSRVSEFWIDRWEQRLSINIRQNVSTIAKKLALSFYHVNILASMLEVAINTSYYITVA